MKSFIKPFYLFCYLNIILAAMVLFDAPVASRNGHFPDAVTDLGRLFSDIGNSVWILLLTAYLVVSGFAALRTSSETDCRRDTCRLVCAAGYIFLTVALSGIVANLFKRLIGRARPVLFDEQGMFSFTPVFNSAKYQSFPSGHATTAAALFVGLAILFPRYRGLLLVTGLWVGLGRVMVGAHYPSDVIAGLALGAWFSHMLAVRFARRGYLFYIDERGWPAPLHHAASRQPLENIAFQK